MPCITNSQTLSADQLDDSSGTTYFVALASGSPITVTFAPPSGGAITNVSCSPTGGTTAPSCGSNSITFGTPDNIEYTVTITYSSQTGDAPREKGDGIVHPLETPTKKPIFKPVTTCPT